MLQVCPGFLVAEKKGMQGMEADQLQEQNK